MKISMKQVRQWWVKERKIIVSAVITGFVITFALAIVTSAYSDNVQKGIAQEVIRFHVLANSNTDEDQNLKLAVRDGILAEIEPELSTAKSISQTRDILRGNLDRIEECAQNIIGENGYNYTVSVQLEPSNFPTKNYGDIAFPAGEYEALRVVIGEGAGNNWWCVMFPPLCFVDITHSEMPDEIKDDLKSILTNEEYDIVVRAKSEDIVPVKVKFKIVEWWQERKHPVPVEAYAKS